MAKKAETKETTEEVVVEIFESKAVKELQEIATIDILNMYDQLDEYTEFISSLQPANDLETIDLQKKALLKLHDDLETRRKEHYKSLSDQQSKFIQFEKHIKNKRGEFVNREKELLKEIQEKKYNDCLEYFNNAITACDKKIFEWVDFKTHIYKETMINSNIYTSKGQLTKKIKELIDIPVTQFHKDYKMIMMEKYKDIITTEYKANGFDLTAAKEKAIEHVEELDRIRKEEEAQQKLEDERIAELAQEKFDAAEAEREKAAQDLGAVEHESSGIVEVEEISKPKPKEPVNTANTNVSHETVKPHSKPAEVTSDSNVEYELVCVRIESDRIDKMKKFLVEHGQLDKKAVFTLSDLINENVISQYKYQVKENLTPAEDKRYKQLKYEQYLLNEILKKQQN